MKAVWLFMAILPFVAAIKVLHIAENGDFENVGFLRKEFTNDTVMMNYTICHWFKLNFSAKRHSSIWVYATSWQLYNKGAFFEALDDKMAYEYYGWATLEHTVNDTGEYLYATQPILIKPLLGKWIHICHVVTFNFDSEVDYNSAYGDLKEQVYLDGQLQYEYSTFGMYYHTWYQGMFFIGVTPKDFEFETFDSAQSFSGMITDFNFWNRSLSENQIKSLANCSSDLKGDIIAWTDQEINETLQSIGNVKLVETDESEFCQQKEHLLSTQVIFPQLNYEHSELLCSMLGGTQPIAINQSLVDYSMELLDIVGDNVCGDSDMAMFWTGLRWNDDQSAFVDKNNDSPYQNITDAIYYSNGDCVSSEYSSLYSVDCESSWPCMNCIVDVMDTYTLKGLCKDGYSDATKGSIDEIYRQKEDSLLTFMTFWGLTMTTISYSVEYEKWIIQSMQNKQNYLLMKMNSPIPLGRHEWIVGNGSNICPEWTPGQAVNLTFSACAEDEFTCDDGVCVDLNSRCDHDTDCYDQSDEIGCQLVTFNKGYLKEIVPKESVNEPRNVTLSMIIKSFPIINAIGLSFTANFNLKLSWSDMRLTFNNLNTKKSMLNIINLKVLQEMWVPVLSFSNALGPFRTQTDDGARGTVEAVGNSTYRTRADIVEGQKFDGSNQIISVEKEYFMEFRCDFDLLTYPFDTQICSILLESDGVANDSLLLKASKGAVMYMDKRALIEYTVVKEEMFICTISNVNISYAQVDIMFERKFEYHLSNTFLQTLLLLVISFMTFFFEVDNFTDKIMVVLTTMLVIATLQSSAQESLPKTAYFKLIDFWFLFSLNIFILTFMYHVFVGYLLSKSKAEDADGSQDSRKLSKIEKLVAKWSKLTTKKKPTPIDNEVIKIKIRRNSSKSPEKDISEDLQKEFPKEAFYVPPTFDKKGLPKTCNTIGLWLFLLSNLTFICIFGAVSVHYYNSAGGGFGICKIP